MKTKLSIMVQLLALHLEDEIWIGRNGSETNYLCLFF